MVCAEADIRFHEPLPGNRLQGMPVRNQTAPLDLLKPFGRKKEMNMKTFDFTAKTKNGIYIRTGTV